MVKPSNPRLMARVLDAIKHLGEVRGSSARQVLEILREGVNENHHVTPRNLTMQVQRALKNAVAAGLIQLRSGRYKILIPLLQGPPTTAVKNSNRENSKKTIARNSSGSKKNEYELEDASNLESGPRSRCSHCKKHKRKGRRGNRRRSKRKRSSKRGNGVKNRTRERDLRKLERRGDEEVSTRRERGKKVSNPSGARGQSEVPNGQRSEEKPRKTKSAENNEDDRENKESESRRDDRNRSESSSGSEGEEEEASDKTKAKRSPSGRKKSSGSRRRASPGSRKSSKKRRSSSSSHNNRRTSSNDELADNNVTSEKNDVNKMDCCDDDQDDDNSDKNSEDDNNNIRNDSKDRVDSRTSI